MNIQFIATAANLVAAVCNIVFLILFWMWYRPNGDKR